MSWKASAFVGGAAFLLSVIVGALGGVAFGAILVRAFIAAILFAGGTAGGQIVIRRYLPELASPATESAPDPEVGRTVDVVVDDEVDLAEGEEIEDSEEVIGEAEFADDEAQYAGDDSDEQVEELDEVSEDQPSDGDPAPEGELIEESEEVPKSGAANLPDLGSYEDSFVQSEGGFADAPETQSGDDPKIMAKAIRTILKREE